MRFLLHISVPPDRAIHQIQPRVSDGMRDNNSSSKAATEKQKNALRKFGIAFSDDITKSQASQMLDTAITESSNRRNGKSRSPALSFSQ